MPRPPRSTLFPYTTLFRSLYCRGSNDSNGPHCMKKGRRHSNVSQTKIGFYGHVKQYHHLKAEIDQAILEVLESGSYVLGPQLVKFEEELAHYMGKREAVGVNSGTDALLLAFLGLGLGAGDEVITTSNTFFATAEAIWLAGATPVFVDCDPRTRNINVTKIEEAIT